MDLPTLGRPIMATSTRSGCFSSSTESTTATFASAASSRSSMPVPCSAAMGKTGTPSLRKASTLDSCETASTLLTATTKGFPVVRSMRASSSSSGVSPARLSTTRTSRAAFLIATCA